MSLKPVVVLLGPPGSGKGTQAQQLSLKHPTWLHVSTGNLFRAEINSKSPLGLSVKDLLDQGKLVSDEVTNEVFTSQVKKLIKEKNPDALLLDGYPRTAPQAKYLMELVQKMGGLSEPLAVELRVAEEEVVGRLADRLVNPRTGRVYHRRLNPPKKEMICDEDGQPLIQRADDQPQVIRSRYQLYLNERDGIVEGLGGKSKLKKIEGTGALHEITQRLEDTIKSLAK